MKCISREREARAIRKFCGRAVCGQCLAARRYVTGHTGAGGMLSFADNGLSIDDAVWGQTCHPEPRRTT